MHPYILRLPALDIGAKAGADLAVSLVPSSRTNSKVNSVVSPTLPSIFNTTKDVPSYEAQVKISRIIEKADKEIKLLEQDLNQEKQKKKALMQLLLTGIVRVNP